MRGKLVGFRAREDVFEVLQPRGKLFLICSDVLLHELVVVSGVYGG